MLGDFIVYVNSFMLIALKNASSDSFEVDFHDIERGLLEKSGGCVYKVIKLIKYLRDTKGGTMTQLKSHLLKTVVMHHVIRQDPKYWSNGNLQMCFVDCIRNLMMGLHRKSITDVFFPEFDMLDRIREGQVLVQACTWLDGLIKKHNIKDTISVFFPEVESFTGGHTTKDILLSNQVQELRIPSGIESKNHLDVASACLLPGNKLYDDIDERKFECKYCEKTFTGVASQEEHFTSKRHLNMVGSQMFVQKEKENQVEEKFNDKQN